MAHDSIHALLVPTSRCRVSSATRARLFLAARIGRVANHLLEDRGQALGGDDADPAARHEPDQENRGDGGQARRLRRFEPR